MAEKKLTEEQEKAVREKIAAGLSRADAIQVLEDQAIDDAIREERETALAKAEKAKGKAKDKDKDKDEAPTPNP